jgi:glycogen debranching enzyme
LPEPLLAGERLRGVVAAVEGALWTPLGLRTLAPDEAGYVGHFGGGPAERDSAYHQGTVWPWFVHAFLEAWVRANGNTPATWAAGRRRFLAGLARHLDCAGIGHVSEIADGDAPHVPHGCPFQAWSVGEAIRALGLGA